LPRYTANYNHRDYYRRRHGYQVWKLIAIVRLRDKMIRFLPGARLLLPTRMDGTVIVGLQAKPMTWIAEGKDFLAAYYELHRQVVGLELSSR
jgi:hypothetical protein